MKRIIALSLVFALFAFPLLGGASTSMNVTKEGKLQEDSKPDFPVFLFDRVVIDPEDMTYNPTNEYDFPSIIKASDYFENPLGEYYLYYGPHDPPGGISLAYADSLEGPWIEYEANPVISRNWDPHYSVSHVASAHPIWIEEENKLFMYFHGENNVTRLASSEDGVNFTYEKSVVSTADFDDISEASYARVFEYTIPEKNNKYIMLLMGNNNGNRKIYLAWSNDGREWETQRTPLISPVNNDYIDHRGNLSGAYYFPWEGRHYITVHASSGNQYLVEVGENFDQEIHHGPFHQAMNGYPDNGRAAARSFIQEGDTIYMFYEAGQRGSTKIALAKSVPAEELEQLDTVEVSVEKETLQKGEATALDIDARQKNGQQVDLGEAEVEYFTTSPEVALVINGEVHAQQTGKTEIWVRVTVGDRSVESSKIPITVIRPFAPFPDFQFDRVVLDPENMNNSGSSIEFPSLIKASDYFDDPLGKYYLYFNQFASDKIHMAYAENLEGPWIEYPDPVISKDIIPGYNGGIQAANATWNEDEGKLHLYFNGGQNAVRLATSTDGVNFTYEKTVLSTADFSGLSQVYQVSVFEHTIAGKDNKYIMLISGTQSGTRKIYLAWSNDGRNWSTQKEPLISPRGQEGGNIVSPYYFPWDGQNFVVYHASSGNIHISRVGEGFDQEEHLGVLYESSSSPPENGRAADPMIYKEGNELYMFFTASSTNNGSKIALAKATIDEDKDPFNASSIKALVEQFGEEGEFANHGVARSLRVHLTAVERFEKRESAEKVIKHMSSFKQLLDHQKENELISEKAYNTLKAKTDVLIKKWE